MIELTHLDYFEGWLYGTDEAVKQLESDMQYEPKRVLEFNSTELILSGWIPKITTELETRARDIVGRHYNRLFDEVEFVFQEYGPPLSNVSIDRNENIGDYWLMLWRVEDIEKVGELKRRFVIEHKEEILTMLNDKKRLEEDVILILREREN